MTIMEVTVKCKSGFQSKLTTLFIQKANSFTSGIFIENGERKANGKSLLGLLSLGIGNGSKVIISIDGDDEAMASVKLRECLEFDEEDLERAAV